MQPNHWSQLVLAVLTASIAFSSIAIAQDGVDAPTDIRRDVREGRIAVQVEGRNLTEDEEVDIATGFHSLLGDAIGAAINDAIEQMLVALDAKDEIEKSLIVCSLSGEFSPKSGQEAIISVYMLRNGDVTVPPQTIEFKVDGKCLIRFCRVYAPIQKPIAIVTENRIVKGVESISERIMRYDDTPAWRSNEIKIVKQELDTSK